MNAVNLLEKLIIESAEPLTVVSFDSVCKILEDGQALQSLGISDVSLVEEAYAMAKELHKSIFQYEAVVYDNQVFIFDIPFPGMVNAGVYTNVYTANATKLGEDVISGTVVWDFDMDMYEGEVDVENLNWKQITKVVLH